MTDPKSSQKSVKERILDAARSLFAASGYNGVSMRDIARAVGVQQSSIYNHFGAKQDILVALMEAHLQRAIAALDAALDGVEGAENRLTAFVTFHVLHHIEQPEDVFLAYMELRSLEPSSMARIMSLRQDYEARLRAILDNGAAAGVFQVSDAAIQTRAILAMLTGVTTWYDTNGPQTPEQVSDVYRTAVFAGVGLK